MTNVESTMTQTWAGHPWIVASPRRLPACRALSDQELLGIDQGTPWGPEASPLGFGCLHLTLSYPEPPNTQPQLNKVLFISTVCITLQSQLHVYAKRIGLLYKFWEESTNLLWLSCLMPLSASSASEGISPFCLYVVLSESLEINESNSSPRPASAADL